jgi:hypothetical protein
VSALHGYTGTGLVTAKDANAFGSHSVTPYAIAAAHPGGTAVYVSLVWLAKGAQEPPGVRVEGDDLVILDLPGGERVTVRLGDVPCAVSIPVHGD